MGRQAELAGMEHPHGDKVLDALIEDRRKVSKKRKKYSDQEVELGTEIESRMAENGIETYVATNLSPPIRVRLTNKKKLIIDEYDDGSNDAEEDDGDEGGAKYAEMAKQKAEKKKPALSEA